MYTKNIPHIRAILANANITCGDITFPNDNDRNFTYKEVNLHDVNVTNITEAQISSAEDRHHNPITPKEAIHYLIMTSRDNYCNKP